MEMDNQLFVDKVNEYGLTVDDTKKLGISYLSVDDTKGLGAEFKKNKSITIPYCLPDGSDLHENGESAPFYRVQYLYTEQEIKAFKSKKQVMPTFAQARKTTNHLYYPSLASGFNWAEVLSNADTPIIITDGELKAAKACKEGFPAVSVGDAESFRDVQNGRLLLSEFNLMTLIKRDVYVCYDSDFKSSDRILSALAGIADELEACGALVKTVVLPGTVGDGKVCLGSFLASQGSSCSQAFLALIRQAVPYGITKELFKLNDKFCYVCHPSAIAQRGISDLLNQDKFKNNLANKRAIKQVIRKGGDIDYKVAPLVQEWVSWPLRNTADRLCYEPGQDRYIDSSYGNETIRQYNTWLGWGCEPVAGDVSLFLKYFNALTSNITDEQRYWFMSWLAYPLQHPGTKMPSCVCLYGRKQGTGKSLLGYIMKSIYGRNFGKIEQEHLVNGFTEWSIDNNFIMADDVTGSKQREFADKLKVLISQHEISINRKNISLYSQRDVINYLFTTNRADAFYLEDSDRRFFVCEVENDLLCDLFIQSVHKEYIGSVENPSSGNSYLFDYLLKHDLSNFNPFSPPPVTAAKASMMDMGMSDLGSFIRELRDNPDQFGNSAVALMTSNEILKLYKSQDDISDSGKRSITANGISRELVAAGVCKLYSGKQFWVKGKRLRFFVIKDKKQWESASDEEIRERLLPYQSQKLNDVYP